MKKTGHEYPTFIVPTTICTREFLLSPCKCIHTYMYVCQHMCMTLHCGRGRICHRHQKWSSRGTIESHLSSFFLWEKNCFVLLYCFSLIMSKSSRVTLSHRAAIVNVLKCLYFPPKIVTSTPDKKGQQVLVQGNAAKTIAKLLQGTYTMTSENRPFQFAG